MSNEVRVYSRHPHIAAELAQMYRDRGLPVRILDANEVEQIVGEGLMPARPDATAHVIPIGADASCRDACTTPAECALHGRCYYTSVRRSIRLMDDAP